MEPAFAAAFNARFEALLEQSAELHAEPLPETPSEPAFEAVLVDVPAPLIASLQDGAPEPAPAPLAAPTVLEMAAPPAGLRDLDQGVPGYRAPSPAPATDYELSAVHDQLEALRTSATEGDTFLPAGSSALSALSAPSPRRARSKAMAAPAPASASAPDYASPVDSAPDAVAAVEASAMHFEETAPALAPDPVDTPPIVDVEETGAAFETPAPPVASTSFLDRFSRRGGRSMPKRASEPESEPELERADVQAAIKPFTEPELERADVQAAIKPLTEPVFESPAEPVVEERSQWEAPSGGGKFGRIGSALIARGLITSEQLDAALDLQRTTGRRIGDSLVDMGVISPFELVRVLADHMGVPFVDLKAKTARPDPRLGAPRRSRAPIRRVADRALERSARDRDGESHRPLRAGRSAIGDASIHHPRDGAPRRPARRNRSRVPRVAGRDDPRRGHHRLRAHAGGVRAGHGRGQRSAGGARSSTPCSSRPSPTTRPICTSSPTRRTSRFGIASTACCTTRPRCRSHCSARSSAD